MITFLIVLLFICCLLSFNLYKAHKKIQKYKLNIIKKTDMLMRYSEIDNLRYKFSFLTVPFNTYVQTGNTCFKEVQERIEHNYEKEKEKIIASHLNSLINVPVENSQPVN